MIRLAVFDLDNTLLTPEKDITDRTAHALGTLKEKGVRVAIATGRTVALTRPFIERLALEGPMIFNNGALIEDEKDRILVERPLPEGPKRALVEYALAEGLPFVLYDRESVSGPENDRMAFFRQWNETHPSSLVQINPAKDAESLMKGTAHKMLVLRPEGKKRDEFLAHAHSLEGIHVTMSQAGYYDIMEKDAHKGKALEALMAHHGISREETMVFGDNDNDAEMLEGARFSYAMKNATPRAKKAAASVTKESNADDGVAKTLFATPFWKDARANETE